MRVCPRCSLKYPDDNDRCFVDQAVLEELADERIGTQLAGQYRIEQRIGEGGMSTVYRAQHILVDRPVAVKIMSPRLARDGSLRERFRREAKNAAALAHPNIVEIYDYGDTEDGTAFLVMELLSGLSLTDVIARGPVPPSRAALLGLQIASGLARAHDFGVIHRDLKPDNVFVCSVDGGRERAKILDFGIARSMHDSRLTNAGEIFGTPQYMAPERVTSIDAGPSADLYALGVILFELVAGRLPFHAEDITGFLIKHIQELPPRLSGLVKGCPPELEELVAVLLAKKVSDRPVDAHQVIKVLRGLASDEDAASFDVEIASSSRAPARTLRATSLERWTKRRALFEEMLSRSFKQGSAPRELVAMLDELRRLTENMRELRTRAVSEQRKLEAMGVNAREGRERLGHAVHTLAEDLSRAREETARAQRWLEARQREVGDLEFQVQALRGQLERIETGYETDRLKSEEHLKADADQTHNLEQELLTIATRFCEPLRARHELRDLFVLLENELPR